MDPKQLAFLSQYNALDSIHSVELPRSFGLSNLIDWDEEAMTDIEGKRTVKTMGGIDRTPSPIWRVKGAK